jgi:hypothetical protein
MRRANSATSWSRNGERTSSETIIDGAVGLGEDVVGKVEARVELERASTTCVARVDCHAWIASL